MGVSDGKGDADRVQGREAAEGGWMRVECWERDRHLSPIEARVSDGTARLAVL